MYKDVLFSLASDTTIGGKILKAGAYKLVNRASRLIIWDTRNWYVTEIKDQTEFDELVLNQTVKIINTIFATKYRVEKKIVYSCSTGSGWHVKNTSGTIEPDTIVQIIEHRDDHVYIFGPDMPFEKPSIDKLISDGTLVLA